VQQRTRLLSALLLITLELPITAAAVSSHLMRSCSNGNRR